MRGRGEGGGTSWKQLNRQKSRLELPGASCAHFTTQFVLQPLQELQRFGDETHVRLQVEKTKKKKTMQCQDSFHKKMKRKKRKEKAGCSSPAEEAGSWALCSHSCNQSVTSELSSTSTQKGEKQELLGVLKCLAASGHYLFFGTFVICCLSGFDTFVRFLPRFFFFFLSI